MDPKLKTKQIVRIGVFGDVYVGKTSLVKRFCTDEFDESHRSSTCGLDFGEKTIEINGGKVSLRIWDSAGQERFTDILAASYFRNKEGVLLVYSVDDRKSFEKVQHWMDQVNEKAPKNVIKILVASKCDSDDIEVTTKEGTQLAEKYQIRFVETSSKDAKRVDEPFLMIAEDYLEQVNNESTAGTLDEKAILTHLDIADIKTTPQIVQKSQHCCFLC